jgi:preprotein translocase subunit SecY
MPIIFAQALMFVPGALVSLAGSTTGLMASLNDYRSIPYNLLYFTLIFVFTYVYTALVVNPQQYAESLARQNAFIPGVKPGADTAEFIDLVTTRITFPGAIMLGLIAILPSLAALLGVGPTFSMFFGGTSLIIMVGVILDTLAQVNNYLLENKYDGLIKGGQLKGRTDLEGSQV